MRVAVILLGMVIVTHFGYDLLSQVTGIHRAVWFYVLMGLWTALLCAFVMYLLWARRKEAAITVVFAAMGIGIIEGLQMLCLLAGYVPDGINACDHVTGLPVTATTISLYCIYLSWSLAKNARTR